MQFVQLVEKQQGAIYKVCFVYASDSEQIKDLYQEVILNLWTAFPRFRGDCKETTWVYRIAMNTCITSLRKSSTRPATVPLPIRMDPSTEAEEEDEHRYRLKLLYQQINRLEKMERALILLWLEEKSYQEIAEILGLSISNVGVKLTRVKEKIKTMLNH